jgi:hypothetical protein
VRVSHRPETLKDFLGYKPLWLIAQQGKDAFLERSSEDATNSTVYIAINDGVLEVFFASLWIANAAAPLLM